MRAHRWILALTFLALVGLSLFPVRSSAEEADILCNGGFEGGFHAEGDVTGQVPDCWDALNLSGNPTLWSTREFAEAYNTGWVERFEGENSILIAPEEYETRGLPFDTVYVQRLEGVEPGKVYRFMGMVLMMYGGSAWPDQSGTTVPPDPQGLSIVLGIDPTGGTSSLAPTVQWGEPTYTNFEPVILEALSQAQGSGITVFFRVTNRLEKDHTTFILDWFTLRWDPDAEPPSPPLVIPLYLPFLRLAPPAP